MSYRVWFEGFNIILKVCYTKMWILSLKTKEPCKQNVLSVFDFLN